MTSFWPVSAEPVALGGAQGAVVMARTGFDIRDTVISQYANSPVLLALVDNFQDYFDPRADFNAFYQQIWNIDTATGYGLDVWGRILGVSRVLQVPTAQFFGYHEAVPGVLKFNYGTFYRGTGLTSNFALSDGAYRRLLIAKAASNICDGSIASINAILRMLFSAYGNCYVVDNLDMTMTYKFTLPLNPVDLAIVSSSGVLPRSTGVSANVVN